ncbi:hypothetical protein PTKIN_Ptkin02bG0059900 [Pterospermum kingtungense]
MEATQKRGFFKGKLAKPFSRPTKTTSHQKCNGSSTSGSSCKVVPCTPMVSTYSYASSKHPTSFYEQKNVANLSSSMQKVSYASFKSPSFYDQTGYANDTWGPADENVDFMATSYIVNARERFKLDRVD